MFALLAMALGLGARWEDGLVAGPALLLLAYVVSAIPRDGALDWTAPLVAGALVTSLEAGSWSLELRDGREERTLARLVSVVVLACMAVGASAVVLAVGSTRPGAGIALWLVGAAAALALIALIALTQSSSLRRTPDHQGAPHAR